MLSLSLSLSHLAPLTEASPGFGDEGGQVVKTDSPLVLHLKHGSGVPDEDLGSTTGEVQFVASTSLQGQNKPHRGDGGDRNTFGNTVRISCTPLRGFPLQAGQVLADSILYLEKEREGRERRERGREERGEREGGKREEGERGGRERRESV